MMHEIMRRMGEAARRIEVDLHLKYGLRDISCAPITVAGGGMPAETFNQSRRISDAEIAEWEQRTGRKFVEGGGA